MADKKENIILIGFICFILFFAIFLQIKTVENTELLNDKTALNSSLRDSALKWQEKYKETVNEIEIANENLNKIRAESLKNNQGAVETENELQKNNTILGQTDVQGKGIIVTLKDTEGATNKNIGISEDIKNYLVHDANLREIVRILKNSGAEAISINDQRIISDTAIICSGNVIRVNDEKVGSPFVISAIGSQDLLYGNVEKTIQRLNKSGIVAQIEKNDNIQIEKYNGTITKKYLQFMEY